MWGYLVNGSTYSVQWLANATMCNFYDAIPVKKCCRMTTTVNAMSLYKNRLLHSTKNWQRSLLKVISHNATIWVECKAFHLLPIHSQKNPSQPSMEILQNQCCQDQPADNPKTKLWCSQLMHLWKLNRYLTSFSTLASHCWKDRNNGQAMINVLGTSRKKFTDRYINLRVLKGF